MGEWLLLPVAFATSTLAAVLGMGGGILLVAVMPGLLPAAAVLPLHAATQLASNASRAVFGWRHLDRSIIPAFTVGAVLGAWAGGEIYSGLDLRWLPPLIGALILLITWVPLPTIRGGGQAALVALGAYQTGLGMLAGATGPLGAAVLLRRNDDRDWLVVNTGLYMSLNHAVRMVAFALIGFNFWQWLPLLAGLVAAVTLGSWLGTRWRSRLPPADFKRWFRWLVSLLALRLLLMPWLSG